MDSEITNFIKYLEEVKRVSENTSKSYQFDLKKLATYLKEHDYSDWNKVSVTILNSYILYLERSGSAVSTISRHIASMRTFFKYLMKAGVIRENLTEQIRVPKVIRKLPEILSMEEMERLLNQPSKETKKGLRDSAMLELLYAAGIRVSELLSLRLEDLDMVHGFITYKQNGKGRTISLSERAKTAVTLYMNQARSKCLHGISSDLLFTNNSGKVMSRQGFWKLLKQYAKEAGIQKEITPYTIRHSLATHMLKSGADLKEVQKILGHDGITTTQIYITMSNSILRKAYEQSEKDTT